MSSFGDLNRVNTNIQSLDSQLSLNRVNSSLAENQLKMSTGLRINRAEDDAAGFSIATKVNSRVAGLSQALQNVGDAKSVLDIAESSFDTILDNLIEMKGLSTQAANETLGETEREFIGEQLAALGADINEVASQTVFQDLQLLNGEEGQDFEGELTLNFQVGEREQDTIEAALTAVNVNQLFGDSSAAAREEIENLNYDFTTATAGSEITEIDIQVGGVTAGGVTTLGIAISDTSNLGDVVDEIDALAIEGLTAEVNEDGDDIVFTSTNEEAVVIDFTGTDAPGDVNLDALTINSDLVEGQGDLDFNDWGADDFRGFMAEIDEAITTMSERVNEVGIAQSSLTTREVTLSQSITANQSAASRIMDADFAKEQSESVRLQILQQTATSALSQANMGPQSVLGFLG